LITIRQQMHENGSIENIFLNMLKKLWQIIIKLVIQHVCVRRPLRNIRQSFTM